LRELGERWRPYRTAAAWYLWQSMRVVTPDAEVIKAPIKPEKAPSTKLKSKSSAQAKKTVRTLSAVK
jgi:hypothetical protein